MTKVLKDILSNINATKIVGNLNIEVNGIAFDSRKVENSFIFVATKGTQVDGHQFINSAIEKGAVAIVCETLPETSHENCTYIIVNDASEALGYLSSNFFDNPSSKMKLVGITGTNGKTTTATLLYRMFLKLGYKAGLFSTVRNYINDKAIDATHTTPDPVQLNRIMSQMVDEGCEYCFMEVSSHSIVQHRITGLDFVGGIFSNITHDHLDYHKTFDEYIKAKKLFFDNLPESAFALTNIDDRNGNVMLQNTKARKRTYSLKSFSDFKCKIIENDFDGMELNIDNREVWTHFIGTFNAYNLLAVYATALLLEQNKDDVLKVLSDLHSVEGRFETIRSANGITAIVDYAHTPDALENVLSTINDIRQGAGQLITVVGAGGDRDKTKRPKMSKISAENSDVLILTSDNPRSENPEDILMDMKRGVETMRSKKILTIADRREAIKTAVLFAHKGDIILIAGKGHENYQEIKGVKYHFDDKEEVKKCFEIN